MLSLSALQKARLSYMPKVPDALSDITSCDFAENGKVGCEEEIRPQFPHLSEGKMLSLCKDARSVGPLKVGVVLSGGQAAGGHNVIAGLFDALKELNAESTLIGFLQGPSGIVNNTYIEITEDRLASYRNQGGFDIIGSGRTKIETKEQFEKTLQTVKAHDLDGLVIIGGDDSNTNAAFLAEYFLENGLRTCVTGVPKTIDGDLKNEAIEISFGFDTACKVYSECIGNIARDAISAKKYYFFVRLMGRSASHITLECAMQTHPNLALIAEEIESKGMHLQDIVDEIVKLIKDRKELGLDYGLILIPEGIIEFLPDMKALIAALNVLCKMDVQDPEKRLQVVLEGLDDDLAKTMQLLPKEIQLQLILDRDPHGNVQVSKIETEKLFIHLVCNQIESLNGQALFYGYEGRSCLPSNFDATYCYSLGRLAALTTARNKTGYIVSFQNMRDDVLSWKPVVSPLLSMLHQEIRQGKKKAVIQKALVDLRGRAFSEFCKVRDSWRLQDTYSQVGPIQYYGPKEITDSVPITL